MYLSDAIIEPLVALLPAPSAEMILHGINTRRTQKLLSVGLSLTYSDRLYGTQAVATARDLRQLCVFATAVGKILCTGTTYLQVATFCSERICNHKRAD